MKLINLSKKDNRLIITGDSPDLIVFDLETKKIINRIQRAHENRIKDLTLIDWNRIEPDEKLSELINETKRQSHQRWLLTCSSDGFIKIWLFNFNDVSLQIKSDFDSLNLLVLFNFSVDGKSDFNRQS